MIILLSNECIEFCSAEYIKICEVYSYEKNDIDNRFGFLLPSIYLFFRVVNRFCHFEQHGTV